jgi:PKD repeat protein
MSYQEGSFDFSNGTNANISALAYSPVNTDYRYVMTTEGDFFFSANAGITWTETQGFTGPGSHYFYGASIVASHTDPGLVYVGGSGYSNPGVFKSVHNGIDFEAFDTGLPETLVFNMALSPDDSLLFAATELGAYVCKTWEGQWYELGDSNLPDQSWWSVDYVESLDKVRFASYGRGVWEFDRDPAVEADFIADNIEIGEGDTINFTDQSLWSPISWEWEFQGAVPSTSTDQNPAGIIYPEAGIFDVTLIVYNHNSADTLIRQGFIEVFPATAVDDLTDDEAVTIYPNPASDIINIESPIDLRRIEIVGQDGKLQLHRSFNIGQTNVKVSIAAIPIGIYIVNLQTESKVISKKLIKR